MHNGLSRAPAPTGLIVKQKFDEKIVKIKFSDMNENTKKIL